MAQTLAQILAGAGGDPYQPAAPGGGMSPLIQMLLQAQQTGQAGDQSAAMPPGLIPGAGALGPGGVPQMGIPQSVPGQPQLPGIGSLAQPWSAGAAGGFGNLY